MSALTIKNEEAVKLIKELAALKGERMTTVVIEAVREKLDRERLPQINEARMQCFLDLGKRVREAADPDWLASDPFEELYDELGLPK